jgi:citrate lyase subunit beta/citryl-CoA lyase
MHRSYLFAPGHNEKLLTKVFYAGADTVILDLEDAVPPAAKDTARELVSHALTVHRAWVRINAPRTALAAADLARLGRWQTASGFPRWSRSTTSAGS